MDDENNTNELPHNLEAEQAILGALLLDNECLEKIGDILLPDYFYSPVHSRIYLATLRLIDNKQLASPVTLKNHFQHDGDLRATGVRTLSPKERYLWPGAPRGGGARGG